MKGHERRAAGNESRAKAPLRQDRDRGDAAVAALPDPRSQETALCPPARREIDVEHASLGRFRLTDFPTQVIGILPTAYRRCALRLRSPYELVSRQRTPQCSSERIAAPPAARQRPHEMAWYGRPMHSSAAAVTYPIPRFSPLLLVRESGAEAESETSRDWARVHERLVSL